MAEIGAVANFLKKRYDKGDDSNILLGDFNIFKTGDATMKALENNGFYIPEAIREPPSDLGKSKHYDQIAFQLKLEPKMIVFSEKDQRAGAFNFSETIYAPRDLDIYKQYFDDKYVVGKTDKEIEKYYLTNWRTYEMSDHLPLWIELKVDFSNQFLEKIRKTTVKVKGA